MKILVTQIKKIKEFFQKFLTIEKIKEFFQKFLNPIDKYFKKIHASIFIYRQTRFFSLFITGIMIVYTMSFPLGLLDTFWYFFPTIWNIAWRLLLIRLCFMAIAIILESWFNSNKDDKKMLPSEQKNASDAPSAKKEVKKDR